MCEADKSDFMNEKTDSLYKMPRATNLVASFNMLHDKFSPKDRLFEF